MSITVAIQCKGGVAQLIRAALQQRSPLRVTKDQLEQLAKVGGAHITERKEGQHDVRVVSIPGEEDQRLEFLAPADRLGT
jgi:hypothetical protein